MSSTAIKSIGDRIIHRRTNGLLHITITQGIKREHFWMLSAWLAGWVFLEGVLIWSWTHESADSGGDNLAYGLYTVFWFFFFMRIGKVWLWRERGVEEIRVSKEGLQVSMLMGDKGKRGDYYALDAASPCERIHIDSTKFMQAFDRAFWSMGGATVRFKARGRWVQFGKQLENQDADALLRLIQSERKALLSQLAAQA